MRRLIATFFSRKVNDLDIYLQRLLQEGQLLSLPEIKLLKKMESDAKIANGTFSVSLYKEEFPELFYEIEKEEPLEDDKAISVYIYRFQDERRKLKLSKRLLDLSDIVSQKGLTYQDLEELRSYVIDDKEKEKDLLYFDYAKDMEDEFRRPKGYKTFVDEIDKNIIAINSSEGSLVTIAAFTSQYKTTFAQNICWKNAVEGKNSVYISLEVPKRMIYWKMVFEFAQSEQFKYHPTYWDIFLNKDWTMKKKPELYEYLYSTIIPEFNNIKGKIIVYDGSDFDEYREADFRRKIEEADDAIDGQLDGVFWDQASLLKFSDVRKGESYSGEVINRFVSFIRKMGNAFRKNKDGEWRYLTNFVLSQINRGGYERVSNNKECPGRYKLSDIAESNELERASSYVFTVYTNDEMRKNNEATMQLLKSRNGRIMDEPMRITVDGKTGLFGGMAFDLKSNQDISKDVMDVAYSSLRDEDESGWDDVFEQAGWND